MLTKYVSIASNPNVPTSTATWMIPGVASMTLAPGHWSLGPMERLRLPASTVIWIISPVVGRLRLHGLEHPWARYTRYENACGVHGTPRLARFAKSPYIGCSVVEYNSQSMVIIVENTRHHISASATHSFWEPVPFRVVEQNMRFHDAPCCCSTRKKRPLPVIRGPTTLTTMNDNDDVCAFSFLQCR